MSSMPGTPVSGSTGWIASGVGLLSGDMVARRAAVIHAVVVDGGELEAPS